MTTDLALPQELTIYHVGALREQWLTALLAVSPEGESPVYAVDGAAVQDVDGAGVQLLISLDRALTQRQRSLVVHDASPVLRQACATLGVAQWCIDEQESAAEVA